MDIAETLTSAQTPGDKVLLLVDDEANILSALKRLLRRDGYTLLSAECGEAGLDILRQRPVDVILSDQRMPGMSGVEFLRQAKVLRPETVRLVLSGYTELQSITNAINEGAIFKFLTKPWDDEQLRANIAEAFHYKALMDENQRLTAQLRAANERLELMLEEKQGQIQRDQQTLGVLHELIQLLPWPLLGVDDSGMIAAANEEAERLLGGAGGLPGASLEQVLPAGVLQAVAAGGDVEVRLDGEPYRVTCRELGAPSPARGRLLVFMREAPNHG